MKVLYTQNDPKWKNVYIPGTKLKIKDYGCVICDLAMLACYYGKTETPISLVGKLKYLRGLVYWQSLTEVYSDIKFEKRLRGLDSFVPLKEVDEILNQGYPVITEVRLNGYIHFVLLYNKLGENDYYMHDPARNFAGSFRQYYQKIYGLAFFKGSVPLSIRKEEEKKEEKIEIKKDLTTTSLNVNTSIVDYLKSKGMDSSFGARRKLYKKVFGYRYFGTANQNKELLVWAKMNL